MHRAHHTLLTSGYSGARKLSGQSKGKETVVGAKKEIKRNNPSSGPELGSRSSLLLEESTTLEQSESFLPGLFFFDNLVEINNHLLLRDPSEGGVLRDKPEKTPKTDIIPGVGKKCLEIKISLSQGINGKPIEVYALIDSGCTISIMDGDWAKANKLQTLPLPQPLGGRLADGSISKSKATRFVGGTISIGANHSEEMTFPLFNTGKHKVYLGYDWLACNQPEINWSEKWLSLPRKETPPVIASVNVVDEELLKIMKKEFPDVFSDKIFT